jgi:hypothetical protein
VSESQTLDPKPGSRVPNSGFPNGVCFPTLFQVVITMYTLIGKSRRHHRCRGCALRGLDSEVFGLFGLRTVRLSKRAFDVSRDIGALVDHALRDAWFGTECDQTRGRHTFPQTEMLNAGRSCQSAMVRHCASHWVRKVCTVAAIWRTTRRPPAAC